MKRFFRWLETKLSRSEASTAADEPRHSEVIKPDINESTIDIFLGDEVVNSMQNQVSAEDVQMPDIYADDHVDTVPKLKILAPSTSDPDGSPGFDPYDTGVLKKK